MSLMSAMQVYDFEGLPPHLLTKTLKECDYKTLKSVRKVNNNLKNFIDVYLTEDFSKKRILYKKQKLRKNGLPYQFLDVFNEDVICNLKKVDLKDKTAFTEYIDFINPNYFKKSPYIYGRDIYNRPFISTLLSAIIDDQTDYRVITIFQRYSDDYNFYVSCGTSIKNYHVVESFNLSRINNLTDGFFKDYLELVNTKTLSSNDYFFYDKDLKFIEIKDVTYNVAKLQ